MRDFFIIDGHCDTLGKLIENPISFNGEEGNAQVTLNGLKNGNVGIQFFAAWAGPRSKYGPSLQRVLKLIDTYCQMLHVYQDTLMPITQYDDIEKLCDGVLGTLLTVEGGDVLEGEISNLRILYMLGVRLMTLTWNNRNEIADGVMERSSPGGLSDFGKQVVKEMNTLGMIIDVSHISERGFWDVIETSKHPVVATHSNAKKLCNHPRNLDDNQLSAIAASGGVVGVNFYVPFLTYNNATITDIIRHIEYIAMRAGINAVAFGSDFDGMDQLPEGIEGPQNFPLIINELLRLNYKEDDIRKLSYKNYLRVLKSIIA